MVEEEVADISKVEVEEVDDISKVEGEEDVQRKTPTEIMHQQHAASITSYDDE